MKSVFRQILLFLTTLAPGDGPDLQGDSPARPRGLHPPGEAAGDPGPPQLASVTHSAGHRGSAEKTPALLFLGGQS